MTVAQSDIRLDGLICGGLALAVLLVFVQTGWFGFVDMDDGLYIANNPDVQAGLTWGGLAYAIRPQIGHWHPLTWLSYMTDIELFGLNPGAHHLVNVAFHAANTALLYLALRRFTGAQRRSALVAALFALHPLHVEPVAWISSRKDMVSGLFFMLALLAYARYVERPSPMRYAQVALWFALGLMSKTMLVTFPFLLLLLDYWPARRTNQSRAPRCTTTRLIAEKLPLFALSVLAGVMAVAAARQAAVLQSFESFPAPVRIANVLAAYGSYAWKTIWPARLAVYYPHPGASLPVRQALGAGLALAGVTGLALLYRQRRYLAAGWLWYLLSLAPVIGFMPFGRHAMADRYTYVALIGPFIMVVWCMADLVGAHHRLRVAASVMAACVLTACVGASWFQLQHWRSSRALFAHAVAVTTDNYIAHNDLGYALLQEGHLVGAEKHFREAIRIKPRHVKAHTNLGIALAAQNQLDDAMKSFHEALRLKPNDVSTHFNLAVALAQRGDTEAAADQLRRVLELDPEDAEAHYSLAVLLVARRDVEQAEEHLKEALKLQPTHDKARKLLDKIQEGRRTRE